MDSDMRDFTWAVDNAIRSETASSLGEPHVRSFDSVVNRAIRSSTTESNLGASRRSGRSFAPVVSWNRTGTEHVSAARVFHPAELKAATNNFSSKNKIGTGNFSVVYVGTLVNGSEVAIKRGEGIWFNLCSFNSNLAFLSRLHHKNLVGLVGFCKERDNRPKYKMGLLVYEYMENGSLYYHLHVDKGSISKLNYWKMRIQIALDVAQGIEYLHNYAPPSNIHRHTIKSSNILFDDTWTAKLSDFQMSSEPNTHYPSTKKGSFWGTKSSFGYLYSNPEYFRLNAVTTKSDVYEFGVVLLELLTGKTAVFQSMEDIGIGIPLVSFAVPAILAGELLKILDPRVGLPNVDETYALQLVALIAIRCVNLNEKDRPTMTENVVILDQALDICDSISYDINSS